MWTWISTCEARLILEYIESVYIVGGRVGEFNNYDLVIREYNSY